MRMTVFVVFYIALCTVAIGYGGDIATTTPGHTVKRIVGRKITRDKIYEIEDSQSARKIRKRKERSLLLNRLSYGQAMSNKGRSVDVADDDGLSYPPELHEIKIPCTAIYSLADSSLSVIAVPFKEHTRRRRFKDTNDLKATAYLQVLRLLSEPEKSTTTVSSTTDLMVGGYRYETNILENCTARNSTRTVTSGTETTDEGIILTLIATPSSLRITSVERTSLMSSSLEFFFTNTNETDIPSVTAYTANYSEEEGSLESKTITREIVPIATPLYSSIVIVSSSSWPVIRTMVADNGTSQDAETLGCTSTTRTTARSTVPNTSDEVGSIGITETECENAEGSSQSQYYEEYPMYEIGTASSAVLTVANISTFTISPCTRYSVKETYVTTEIITILSISEMNVSPFVESKFLSITSITFAQTTTEMEEYGSLCDSGTDIPTDNWYDYRQYECTVQEITEIREFSRNVCTPYTVVSTTTLPSTTTDRYIVSASTMLDTIVTQPLPLEYPSICSPYVRKTSVQVWRDVTNSEETRWNAISPQNRTGQRLTYFVVSSTISTLSDVAIAITYSADTTKFTTEIGTIRREEYSFAWRTPPITLLVFTRMTEQWKVEREEEKKVLLQRLDNLEHREGEMTEREKTLEEKERRWNREKKKRKERETVTVTSATPIFIEITASYGKEKESICMTFTTTATISVMATSASDSFLIPSVDSVSAFSSKQTEMEYDDDITNLRKELYEREGELETREKMLLRRDEKLERDIADFNRKYAKEMEGEEKSISPMNLSTPVPPIEQTTARSIARKKEKVATKRICLNVLKDTTLPSAINAIHVASKQICLPYFSTEKRMKSGREQLVGRLNRKLFIHANAPNVNRCNYIGRRKRKVYPPLVAAANRKISNLQLSRDEWFDNETTKSLRYTKGFVRIYQKIANPTTVSDAEYESVAWPVVSTVDVRKGNEQYYTVNVLCLSYDKNDETHGIVSDKWDGLKRITSDRWSNGQGGRTDRPEEIYDDMTENYTRHYEQYEDQVSLYAVWPTEMTRKYHLGGTTSWQVEPDEWSATDRDKAVTETTCLRVAIRNERDNYDYNGRRLEEYKSAIGKRNVLRDAIHHKHTGSKKKRYNRHYSTTTRTARSSEKAIVMSNRKNQPISRLRQTNIHSHCSHCICNLVHVINNINSILKKMSLPLDRMKALNCSSYKETRDEIVISSNANARENEILFSRYNVELLKDQRYTVLDKSQDYLNGDLKVENDDDIVSLPGTNLNLPCKRKEEGSVAKADGIIAWLSSIGRPNYTWKRVDGGALFDTSVGKNGDLQLRNINAKDTGNYTCVMTYASARNQQPVESTYKVSLQVVTLPRYVLHGVNRYRARSCDERHYDVLATYLPLELNSIMCEANICNAYVLTPSCYRNQITVNVLIIPSHVVKLTTANSNRCNVFCLKAIQDKLSFLLSENLRTFFRKSVLFRLPHLQERLVPILDDVSPYARWKKGRINRNAEFDGTAISDIGLFSSCPAGYGLGGTHCVPCNLGTYSEDEMSHCERCPVGTYQPNHGARACRACMNPLTSGCRDMVCFLPSLPAKLVKQPTDKPSPLQLWNSFSAIIISLASVGAILTILLLFLRLLRYAKKRFRLKDIIESKGCVEEEPLIENVHKNNGEGRKKKGKICEKQRERKTYEKRRAGKNVGEDESCQQRDRRIICSDSYRSHNNRSNHYTKQPCAKGPNLPEYDFDTRRTTQ